MIEFRIENSQIGRLKTFNDHVKKMESFSPLNANQLFVVKDNKLNIYGQSGGSGAGHIEATFDITNKKKDREAFEMPLQQFINYLEKANADETQIKVDKSVFHITSKNLNIKQSLIFDEYTDERLDEVQDWITTTLATAPFKAPITVNLGHKNIMMDFATITKNQNTNQQIMLGKNYIKTADVLCIAKFVTKDTVATEDEILIDRDILSVCKGIDSFTISSDKKYFYFDFDKNGIKMLFTPKTHNWSYPTEDDLTAICPEDTQQIELKINSTAFFEAIDKFEGVFDSSSWKYGQVRFVTPADFLVSQKLELKHNNVLIELNTDCAVEVISDTDGNNDFEFILSSFYFNFLKDILMKEPNFTLKYSSNAIDAGKDIACIVENSLVNVIMAKIIP